MKFQGESVNPREISACRATANEKPRRLFGSLDGEENAKRKALRETAGLARSGRKRVRASRGPRRARLFSAAMTEGQPGMSVFRRLSRSPEGF
jgi:hypothetical protein